jgi:hypothetical protein
MKLLSRHSKKGFDGLAISAGAQFAKCAGKAHHEMEWFFATTQDFLPRTSIMVVKTTHTFKVDLRVPALLHECWQRQRGDCTMWLILRNGPALGL